MANYSGDAAGNNYDSAASTTVVGLVKGKLYHAHVYAMTAAGPGTPGVSTTPRTAIDVPGLIDIRTIVSGIVGGVKLEVTWNGPSDTGDTTNATFPILSFAFDFSTKPEFDSAITVTLMPQVCTPHSYEMPCSCVFGLVRGFGNALLALWFTHISLPGSSTIRHTVYPDFRRQ